MSVQLQMDFLEVEKPESFPDILGLAYLSDFVDPQQEAELIRAIDAASWIAELKRRVQHYGWRYDYKARSVTPGSYVGPLPEWLAHYAERLHAERLFPDVPDQVIVNEYQPGQGIAPHIDCVPCFTATVASLSLGSSCIMEFTHLKTQEKIPILLERRSLVVLSGDARYRWQHAIPHRKTDRHRAQMFSRSRRLSLTFRKVVAGG
jgi:alkylated DNA repair dioxygenase AlkB